MRLRLQFRWIGIFIVALATTLYLFGQQPGAPTTPPAQTPAPASPQAPAGRGAGRGSPMGSFPTRAPAPPEEVAHGKDLFEANCSFCHGSDARGGETGPNLVRAQVVLDDKDGNLIGPIVHTGFPAQGMPKFNFSDSDIRDIAAFLHSQPLATHGAPTTADILVGSAQAGETYFNANCTMCHSTTGDLAGIGGKYDAKMIQNMIVSGGIAGGRGVGVTPGGPAPPPLPPTTVTVTLPSGQTVQGKLDQISAFVVSLTEADGTYRTFARNGAVPKVVIHDPIQWHIDMLPKWNDTDIHNLTAYLVTLK